MLKRKSYYLFVGRLSAEKGVNVLLEAWKKLGNEELIIAGEGPEMENFVKQYGDLPNVIFAGEKSRQDVLSLMKHCRALIFPSVWYEGLPLTLIEALATGTPVLASSLGAMQENDNRRNKRFIISPGNAVQLAETVKSFNGLLQTGNLSFYENARAEYLKKYHPEKAYQQIIDIYKELLPPMNK